MNTDNSFIQDLKKSISEKGYRVRISHQNAPDIEAIGTNTKGDILLGMGITEVDALEDLENEIRRYQEAEEQN